MLLSRKNEGKTNATSKTMQGNQRDSPKQSTSGMNIGGLILLSSPEIPEDDSDIDTVEDTDLCCL